MQVIQSGADALDMRMSVLKPKFPWIIYAGWKRVADDKDLMKLAWQQCGLAEPWNLAFQLEACDMMDAGTLFPTSAAAAIPDGLEPEPTDEGDAVDDDGNLCTLPKLKSRGRPLGAKNKAKQTDTAEASDSAAASGSIPTAAAAVPKKKRGRPAGSKNKAKPGTVTTLAAPVRGRGRGRATGGSSRKVQRISTGFSSDSGSDQNQLVHPTPGVSLMSLSGESSDSSEREAASVASSDEAASVKEIGTDEGETYSSVSEVTTSESDNPLEGCSNDDE